MTKKKFYQKKSLIFSIKRANRQRPRGFIKVLLRFFLLLITWMMIGGSLIILWFIHDLPDINYIETKTRKPSITFQTEEGTILATYGDFFADMVKISDLPPYLPQALLAVEDRRFYYHFGIDFISLIRAAYHNYKADRVVQGGSTLTQQLAKNFLFTQGKFSPDDRSIKRKIQEALLAFWLEWHFTKEQILTLYLNRVYLGANTYGIEAAAQRYFNKSARKLSVFESALIAGLLKAPSRYSPAFHPKRSIDRTKVVLDLMVEAGFIHEAKSYFDEGVKNFEFYTKESDTTLGYRYFCDWIYSKLHDYINMDQDIVVIVTLDPAMQNHAQQVCTEAMAQMGKSLKTTEIALVALSPDGAVRAMIGGLNYRNNKFNHAVSARRQPGSAFKPIVYMAALENGVTLDEMIDDTPITIHQENNGQKNWAPKNYKYIPKGQASVYQGFIKSVNSITVRLAQRIGIQKIIEVAQRMGITSQLTNHISLALGTLEVNLLELTTAIATFDNNGRAVWSYAIEEIRDRQGNILFKRKPKETPKIVEHDVLTNMRQLLRGVIVEGTGRNANIGRTVFGKTGSNANRDAWFTGYRSIAVNEDGIQNIALGVWTGNDNNAPMHPTSTGGRLPAKVAAAFLKGPHPSSVMTEDFAIKNNKTGNNNHNASSLSIKKHHSTTRDQNSTNNPPLPSQKSLDDILNAMNN